MGGSPKTPDPYQTSAAQQSAELGSAQSSAIINNPNQYGPYGSRTYSQAGWETVYDATGKPMKVPRYNETTTLSPDQQRLLGLSTQMQYNLGQTGVSQSAKLRDYLGQGMDTSKMQPWTTAAAPGQLQGTFGGNNPMQMKLGSGGPIQRTIGNTGNITGTIAPTGNVASTFGNAGGIQRSYGSDPNAYSADRDAVTKALMARYDEQANPARMAQEAQLAARGLAPGSQQAANASDEWQRGRTDASMQAILAGGQEQSRLLGEARQAGQFGNAAQQQAYEQAAGRGQFANQAELQRFQEAQARAGFGNQAEAQRYQEALSRAGFGNQAQAQAFGQMAQQGQFANAAQAQAYQQALQRAGFANDATTQNYQLGQDYAGSLNNLRQGQMQEGFALRNQPLNEISALLSGSQVASPQFSPFSRQGVNAANVGNNVWNAYGADKQASSAWNNGLFNLLGAGIQSGPLMGLFGL